MPGRVRTTLPTGPTPSGCSSDHYTARVGACTLSEQMDAGGHRLNITLDAEHAAKLASLAERTHVQEGTLARSLLTIALDDADPEPRNLVSLLDGLGGAFERAQQGVEDARAGRTISLDDL